MTAAPPPPERPRPLDVVGLVTLLVATGAAILIYMGWAYLDAYLRPFLLKPTDLNYRPDEYALYGLNLFSPAFLPWMAAIPLALAILTHRATLLPRLPARARALITTARAHRLIRPLGHPTALGTVITITAMVLAMAALSNRPISNYLLLLLVIVGPLLLTWSARATPLGRVAFAAAVAIAIFCSLWAASIYAQQRGARSAQATIDKVADRPQVALYTADSLGLNVLNVKREPLGPGAYKFQYLGLRLLMIRADTYYLIPDITPNHWAAGHHRTFVFKEEDDVRLEILPGNRPG
ncbi:hypothetical protein ACIBKY_46595 [Nonomuraea sp. NPDC050394]|uniref:hypothetical protein n=1 Tax=Nonomuraea sp. NPDC050394 TaxID=3364363 RepID=UPI0037937052